MAPLTGMKYEGGCALTEAPPPFLHRALRMVEPGGNARAEAEDGGGRRRHLGFYIKVAPAGRAAAAAAAPW